MAKQIAGLERVDSDPKNSCKAARMARSYPRRVAPNGGSCSVIIAISSKEA